MFMNLLSSRSPNTDNEPPEFQIDDTYSVPGIYLALIWKSYGINGNITLFRLFILNHENNKL